MKVIPQEFNKAVVFDFDKEIDYAENAIVSKTVLKKKTGNISLFAFDKGQELSEHTTPFDAMVQIVDGEGTVIIDKKPFTLKKGENIIMPANIPHAVRANSKFKMVLTMIKEIQAS